MEGVVTANIESREKEPYKMRVTLFRHGPARYEQGKVEISEADDLTEEGKELVRQQAEQFANEIDKDEEIVIWSSPMGRTLETATILLKTLREKGFKIRLKDSSTGAELLPTPENSISIIEEIEEVRGLNVKLFSALVNGGPFTLSDGSVVHFDKNKTNPEGYIFQEYYYHGGYKKFLESTPDIPEEVRAILLAVEDESSVHARFDRVVRRLTEQESDKKTRTILVTHHVAMKDYTENEVYPADYINVV